MSVKVNNLEELRRKKALLKTEVEDLQHLVTFDNVKESMSAFTNGFTDQFLKEVPAENGEIKTAINGEAVVQKVREEIKDKVLNKNAVLGLAQGAERSGLLTDALKLSAAAIVGNFAKKHINSSSWQKRIIGLLLIYMVPSLLRFLREKLDEYRKNRSVSSMEQLI